MNTGKMWVGLLGLTAMAVSSVGCTDKDCKKARAQFDQRVVPVQEYIYKVRPEMTDLANGGCTYMLALVASYPSQAKQVRALADKKFAVTDRLCQEYRYYDRMHCEHGGPRVGNYNHGPTWGMGCMREHSRVCVRWSTRTTITNPYEYNRAVQLSADIDDAFAETHAVCSAVAAQDQAAMEASLDQLEEKLVLEVEPEAKAMLAAACGS